MKKIRKKQKQMEYRRQVKVIERKYNEKIPRAELKLLLHRLIFHFDGYANQQQLVIDHMSSRFHWGNRRTVRVLKSLAAIGVIKYWRAPEDKWTLFSLVKGFVNECSDRIIKAGLAIKERISLSYSAIISIGDDERISSNLIRFSDFL